MSKLIKIAAGYIIIMNCLAIMNPANADWFFGNDTQKLTYVVINNAAIYDETEEEIHRQTVLKRFTDLTNERSKSSSKRDKVIVLFTTQGLDSYFEGTIDELFNAGLDIINEAKNFKASPSDLELAYKFVADHIETFADEELEIEVIHIGKFFSVPYTYDGSEPIHIPQELPTEIPLGTILNNEFTKSFSAFMVMPEQMRPLRNYLSNAGVQQSEDSEFSLDVNSISNTVQKMGIREHMRIFARLREEEAAKERAKKEKELAKKALEAEEAAENKVISTGDVQ